MRKLFLALAAAALMAACSTVDGQPATTADGALTGPNGMTLYTFDRDAAGSGKSVCNGPCATLWPPLLAADADTARRATMPSSSATTARSNGPTRQAALLLRPRYQGRREDRRRLQPGLEDGPALSACCGDQRRAPLDGAVAHARAIGTGQPNPP